MKSIRIACIFGLVIPVLVAGTSLADVRAPVRARSAKSALKKYVKQNFPAGTKASIRFLSRNHRAYNIQLPPGHMGIPENNNLRVYVKRDAKAENRAERWETVGEIRHATVKAPGQESHTLNPHWRGEILVTSKIGSAIQPVKNAIVRTTGLAIEKTGPRFWNIGFRRGWVAEAVQFGGNSGSVFFGEPSPVSAKVAVEGNGGRTAVNWTKLAPIDPRIIDTE